MRLKKLLPWILLVLCVTGSAWRLRHGSWMVYIGLAPILAIATLGEFYDSLQKAQTSGLKLWWQKIPLLQRLATMSVIHPKYRPAVAIVATVFAVAMILLAGTKQVA